MKESVSDGFHSRSSSPTKVSLGSRSKSKGPIPEEAESIEPEMVTISLEDSHAMFTSVNSNMMEYSDEIRFEIDVPSEQITFEGTQPKLKAPSAATSKKYSI